MKIKTTSIGILFSGILAALFCIVNILFGASYENVACIILLILSGELIIWSRTNYLLLIIMCIMAYCNYSVVFADYLNIIHGTMFTQYAGSETATQSIYILLMFEAVLCCMLAFVDNSKVVQISSDDMEDTIYNSGIVKLFVLVSNIILLLILVFGFKRPDTLGDRGSPSTIYEYSIIIFVLCFYFGNKFKWCKNLTCCMLALYVAQNFLYSGRITGLQLIIVVYVMILESKWSIKKVLPFAILGFLGMSIIGVSRGAFLSGNMTVGGILNILKERKFTLDTAFSAYHTSMTFVMTEKRIAMGDRIRVLFGFLKSIIVGGYNSVDSNVARYTAQFYHHYDGGFLPFYFHFYMGWIGILVIAAYLTLIANIMTKVSGKTKGLGKCLCVYIVASTFRWYIYSPIQITRGILLLSICYFLVEQIFIIASKKR